MDDIKCEIIPDGPNYDLNFKIIVIGDAGVGKSCLTKRATKNIFEEEYSTTIGFEFYSLNVKINEKTIKLQIWDTCGQEIYRSLISSFYKNSSLAFIVYSIDNLDSFNNIESWLNEIKLKANTDIKLFLIGNKVDLEDKRQVKFLEGKKFIDEFHFNFFIETSAKTGFNAKEVFIEAAKVLYIDQLNYIDRSQHDGSLNDIILNEHNQTNQEENRKNSQGCCK